MILRIAGFDNDIIFDDCTNTRLIIEDHKLFSKILFLLNGIVNNKLKTNEILLLNDKEDYVLPSEMDVIINPTNINLNSKTMLTSLYKYIEKSILHDEDKDFSYKRYIEKINGLLVDELYNLNLDFEYNDDLLVNQYLKSINVKFTQESISSTFDLLMNYLELVSELNQGIIIVLCNCFNYFDDHQLEELCKYKNYKHINILFIENSYRNLVNTYFKTFIIDNDFNEDFVQDD